MKKHAKKLLFILTLLCFNIIIINPNINAKASNSNNVNLVIIFKENFIDEQVENIIIDSKGEILNKFPSLGAIEVSCSPNLIPKIKSNDTVKSLSPNHTIKILNRTQKAPLSCNNISDDFYNMYQWDIKKITNNGKSFDIESGNHNVIVGIIDSGIDRNHPDLINNFLGGKNLVPANFKNNFSETGDPNDLNDRLGHGTNVAGFIAANGKTKGIAPNIGFKSYRVFDENGETNATICSSAILEAVSDGVKVINLSIGGV